MDPRLTSIIMAAQEGGRMKSDYPTVLHRVAGEPMLGHVLEVARALAASRTIVVLGSGGELIRSKLAQDLECVEQKRLYPVLKGFKGGVLSSSKGEVLVLCADTPLLQASTLKQLIQTHRREKAAATVLTAMLHDPSGYARVIRNNDRIAKIVEEKKTTIYERAVEEVDSRIYCFDSSELFSSNNYYFTDAIQLMARGRKKVIAFMSEDRDEVLKVHSRKDLSIVNKILHRRIAELHMENGVTIVDPETTFIDKKVEIGRDSVIYPFTILEGETVIGERCEVGPGAHLISSSLGNGVKCRQSVIKEKKVKAGRDIPPYFK